MGLYRIRAIFFVWRGNEAHFHWQVSCEVGAAVALTLIFGLEVWRCVVFAGLFVWAVEVG